MSKWNRPMRNYMRTPLICPVCRKVISIGEAVELVDDTYRHRVNCTAPTGRPSAAARAEARRRAGVE